MATKKTTTTKKKTTTKKEKEITYIYGIYLSDKLAYVGSTEDIETRTKTHLTKLEKLKHGNKTLSKLYALDNNIEIKPIYIMNTDNSLARMMLEMCTICYLQPPSNRCVYQVGMSRLVFSKVKPDLAKEIIDILLKYYNK